MRMSNTPAGWYPQADGRQRYWDGETWTEHFAPGTPEEAVATAGVTAFAAAEPAGSDTQAVARPWFMKKRFIAHGSGSQTSPTPSPSQSD